MCISRSQIVAIPGLKWLTSVTGATSDHEIGYPVAIQQSETCALRRSDAAPWYLRANAPSRMGGSAQRA